MSDGAARETWEEVARDLDPLLAQLQACESRPRSEHEGIPQEPGVYLFSEHGQPLYVGQTRNIRERLRDHTIPAAQHTRASFAYLIATQEAQSRGLRIPGTRPKRAKHPDFAPLFDEAKRRVREMDVQFALESDANIRTVFEVYASLILGTRFNSFETH